MDSICKYEKCREPFIKKRKGQDFCNRRCRDRFESENLPGKRNEMGSADCKYAKCGKSFKKKRHGQEFCNPKCRYNFHNEKYSNPREDVVQHPQELLGLIQFHFATVKESSEIAAVSASTIRRWVACGKLGHEVYCERILISRRSLERLTGKSAAPVPRPVKTTGTQQNESIECPDLQNLAIN